MDRPTPFDVIAWLEQIGYFRPSGSPFIPPRIQDINRKKLLKAGATAKFLRDFGLPPAPSEVTSGPFDPRNINRTRDALNERDLYPFLDHIKSDEFDKATIGVITKDKTWDAAGWYCPIHFYGYEWGIYIRPKSVYEIALDILNAHSPIMVGKLLEQNKARIPKLTQAPDVSEGRKGEYRRITENLSSLPFGYRHWLDHPIEQSVLQAIKAAYFVLYHHELFHHMTESLGLAIQAVAERPAYVSYADSVYKRAKGTPDLLEEALANAYAYRATESETFASFLDSKPDAGKAMQATTQKYLRERFPTDPPGYNRALEFVADDTFKNGVAAIIDQMRESNPTPLAKHVYNAIIGSNTAPIFGPENVRCVEVPDLGTHVILDKNNAPTWDNRGKKLQKLAKLKGFDLARTNGGHEIWKRPGSPILPIPKSNEVKDGTAESILKEIDNAYRLRDFEQIMRTAREKVSTGVTT